MPGPKPGLLGHQTPVLDNLGVLNESIKQVGGARLTHPNNMKVGKTSEAVVGVVSCELVPTRVLEIGQELFSLLQQNILIIV